MSPKSAVKPKKIVDSKKKKPSASPTVKKAKPAAKSAAKSAKAAKVKAAPPVKKPKLSAAEVASTKRRNQAQAAMEAALKENTGAEPSTSEEEFDPAAFFAASGGKGVFRAHVMRKERVDFNLPVRYRYPTGPLVFNAELTNLSKGGLCLKTEAPLKAKAILKIEIPLPHTSELFTVQAEVVWCEPAPSARGDKKASNTGLRFLAMSLAKQTVINNFIQQRRDEIIMAKIGLDKFTDSVPVAGLD